MLAIYRQLSFATVISLIFSSAGAHSNDTDETGGASNDITEFSIEQLLDIQVFTASRFNQKTSEAPSKVTVITADDIRQYGYRTVKDALNSIPGLYTNYDRNYSNLGVRGFGVPGDYNTRILMLLDGQRVNENTYESFGIDYDSIVNIDLIERIEFSSGPGSAIYGANALFGVINIITKSGEAIDGVQVSADHGSENSRRARITAGSSYDNGIEALVSASVYKSDGADLYFPEFDDPATNNGVAVGMDYHQAENLFLKLKYNNWGFEAVYNTRKKGIPTASYGQEFNTSPSETIDSLGLATITYDAYIDNKSEIYGSLSLGRYEYSGDFIYDYPPLTVNRDESVGQWTNTELRYQTTHFDRQRIIVGAEYQYNNKQDQANFDIDPYESYLDDSRSGNRYGIYLQDEVRLTEQFILNAGLRYDHNTYDNNADNNETSIINPRLALIYALQPETTVKLIYGTAYRNPNAYELYYGETLGYLPSNNLQPEEIDSYEIDLEHYLDNNFKVSASIYLNKTANLIGLNADPVSGDLYFDNLDNVEARGTDLTAEYISNAGLRLRSSYSYVDAENITTGGRLVNSPENLLKVNLTSPIFNPHVNAGIEFQYTGSRLTPDGENTGGFAVTNLTLSSQNMYKRLILTASIYNLFDKRYNDPVSDELTQGSIAQDGRSFRIKATYTF